MFASEEVTAGIHTGDGLKSHLSIIAFERSEYLGEGLKHFDVEDKLFKRGGESALQPARGVDHHVYAAKNAAPGGHQKFIDALLIGCIRGSRC